jgi:hypothetical protein
LAGAGLVGLFVFRRRRNRRRHHIGGLFLLWGLLSPTPTQAQAISHELDSQTFEEPASFRTPRQWAFELRFGPYRPNVDSEFSGTSKVPAETPYKTTFGGSRHLMSQFEIDWQVFQAFGSLSVGAVVGYYNQSAKAFEADSTTGASTGVRSKGDSTSLRLIPTAALLVYRLDWAAEQWRIPLVPYAKVGLNYTFWQIKDGNGRVPSYLGGHGSGGTAGWQAAAGLALQLDFLDPSAARNLDIETGINHSYLFFEWNHVEATGLGMKDKLHLGDSRWVIGMMCEF